MPDDLNNWLRRLPGLDADDALSVAMYQIGYGLLVLLVILLIIASLLPETGPPSEAPLLP